MVTVSWALLQQGWRATALHAVTYARARHWMDVELFGGARPLEQLRAATGDPWLAEVVTHVALRADGTPVEDDAEEGGRFMEAVWCAARMLQQAADAPVVFALVSGRRRTLVADLVVAFQLLARPQDRLVELRLTPADAIDPAGGFFFPGQASPASVRVPGAAEALSADAVDVRLVDVQLPRLRGLLPPSALLSFAAAVAASASGAVSVDLTARTVTVGGRELRLSANQMVWYAALAVARHVRADGALRADDDPIVPRVWTAALAAWHAEPYELSPAWDGDLRLLRPIRSRLRRELQSSLQGSPWAAHAVPQLSRTGTGASVVTRERLPAAEVRLCARLMAVCAALAATPG
jgi:hypothetical protein